MKITGALACLYNNHKTLIYKYLSPITLNLAVWLG